jgi:hypothetical protein
VPLSAKASFSAGLSGLVYPPGKLLGRLRILRRWSRTANGERVHWHAVRDALLPTVSRGHVRVSQPSRTRPGCSEITSYCRFCTTREHSGSGPLATRSAPEIAKQRVDRKLLHRQVRNSPSRFRVGATLDVASLEINGKRFFTVLPNAFQAKPLSWSWSTRRSQIPAQGMRRVRHCIVFVFHASRYASRAEYEISPSTLHFMMPRPREETPANLEVEINLFREETGCGQKSSSPRPTR